MADPDQKQLSGARAHVAPREEYIDLATLWRVAWLEKLKIVAATAVIAIAAVVVSLLLPNIYRAEVVLAPVAEQRPRGLAALVGRFGALGALGEQGLNDVAVDDTTLAIEVMRSREFLTSFIRRHELLVPLFAASSWDPKEQRWIIDPDIYDETAGKWVRKPPRGRVPEPSDWEAYEAFSRLLSIDPDAETGMIRVSIESRSPTAAKQWLDLLVHDINERMRAQDLSEAAKSIEFLEGRLKNTSVTELRMMLNELIKEQMKTLTLAEAREEYAFRTVDPAVVPEEKARPPRALICIVATFVGGLLVTIIVVTMRLNRAPPGVH